MTANQSAALLWISRAFMATLFVFSGIEKIFKYSDVSAFASAAGVPLASTLMPLAILLELGCGAMLLTHRYCRSAALILAIWIFVLNLAFHQFWKAPAEIWQLMVDNFFHSFVMVGGLLYVFVFGAEPPIAPDSVIYSKRR